MKTRFHEILSVKVPAGSRTLYLDLKQCTDGSHFLSISEVPRGGSRERSWILVDETYVDALRNALGEITQKLQEQKPLKSYTVEEKRRDHGRAYKRWTREEDDRLREAYARGSGIEHLARDHGRAPTAVLSRMYQLGVITMHDEPRWE
jgi:hypothetical protein